jgi:hypothetical protein
MRPAAGNRDRPDAEEDNTMPAETKPDQQPTVLAMPKCLGYAAKRRWLIENDRADEAGEMRLAVNEACWHARSGGTNGAVARLVKLAEQMEGRRGADHHPQSEGGRA